MTASDASAVVARRETRERFAVAAMQSWLAYFAEAKWVQPTVDEIANIAMRQADALLRALEQS